MSVLYLLPSLKISLQGENFQKRSSSLQSFSVQHGSESLQGKKTFWTWVILLCLEVSCWANRTLPTDPFILKDSPIMLVLQHGNTSVGNYALNRTFVLLPSLPWTTCLGIYNTVVWVWESQWQSPVMFLTGCVWVVNAAQTWGEEWDRRSCCTSPGHIYN